MLRQTQPKTLMKSKYDSTACTLRSRPPRSSLSFFFFLSSSFSLLICFKFRSNYYASPGSRRVEPVFLVAD